MNTRRHYRARYLIPIGLLLIGLGIWGGITLVASVPRYNNLDEVRRTSDLEVVLPGTLPRNTTIADHPSYDAETGSIITRITVGDNSVTFSQQKRPETDLSQIDAQDTFLVNAGSVYILKGEAGRLQAIVETTDSWLIVNADAKLGISTFKDLLESLDTM